jgi:hypothetical protein
MTSLEVTLTNIFSNVLSNLMAKDDDRIGTFNSLGVDPKRAKYAEHFTSLIIAYVFNNMEPYIASFCTPADEESARHGLLSQWRGYGADGGYAIQFDRYKLEQLIVERNKKAPSSFIMRDVSYDKESHHNANLLAFKSEFETAFLAELDRLINFTSLEPFSPLKDVSHGALNVLLDGLLNKKNHHFREEREVRLSFGLVASDRKLLKTKYYVRDGLIVPYVESFDVVRCIKSIVVGPAPRQDVRVYTVMNLLKTLDIQVPVIPSMIPFTRQ